MPTTLTSPTPDRRSRVARGDHGVSVIITSLLIIPLMLFAAFGVDVASFYSRVSQIQRAADAAALAGTVWMPDLAKATTVATESLAKNGIVHGQDDITVVIKPGSTDNSLRVEITDGSATTYFSRVINHEQEINRAAEAEYNVPIPLGSPLNYFGGDASKNTTYDETTFTVVWPTDYFGRSPTNAPCNVGTSADQNLGRWTTSASFDSAGFGAGPQCTWAVVGQQVGTGTSDVPPPDYTTRVPNDGTNSTGCRVRANGSSSGTILGRWRNSSFSTDTGGSAGPCTWRTWGNVSTPSASHYQNAGNITNRPCNIGYTGGSMQANGSYSSGRFTADSASGNRLCTFVPQVSSVTTTLPTPNQIDPTRSPNFWAQIHGPGADQQSGDAYSTRCTTSTNCSTPNNDLYVEATDPNQGYWYVVKIPPGGGGQTSIRVFDAQLTPGDLSAGTGDSTIAGSPMLFNTEFRVFEQDHPLDFNTRTPIINGTRVPGGLSQPGNQTPSSCNWNLQGQAGFQMQWVELCSFNAAAEEIYLVNVRTSVIGGTSSAGRNGYAIEALTNGGTGVQPAVYAYSKMVMYNNVSDAGGEATFYIAEVGPQYAGKTLVLELFDPGEASGQAWMYPTQPSPTLTGAVVDVPASDCAYSSTRSGYPRSSDQGNAGRCAIRTADGSSLFNGHWVTLRISVPGDYVCTPGVNPETTPGSCWWGIRYDFSSSSTDTTTWKARIEGNPVHLTQ